MSTGDPPSGVVTFLFTDIEGSTRRWEADAAAMRAALAAHDEVLRNAIQAHGGFLFKHTGDGVCATFSSPKSAVAAAVAAQQKLELPVRMGLATGEAELRESDYFGAVLNRGARVMAAGHGAQILLDGTTADLLNGIDLMALGARRLRDIAKPVEIFQVRAEGLRTEFPPLTTADPTPGNLRLPTTSLVGRDADLAELETALKAHRLVTLTGVGGVGKTRLALELADRSAFAFSDGVFVIELAAVGDPAAVPEAVATAVGIAQQPGLSVADSVAAALEGRSRLLVLDNCEHVLDAAADMIAAILSQSATVRVLATSREGLRVSDEQLWPVPSLDVSSSAPTLFVERASAVAPGVSLSEADAAVVEVCRRLDGIPLAIELAASRMQSMSVTELRDRLDDRFRLLVGSRRGLERHQTLRHAVQWSYDLLGDAEKQLLARCSVFAGGFELLGVCAVAGSDDEFATLDLLDSLVRKSLLVADSSSGRTRFSMLETIRQFAEEQLVARNEASEVRAAHARYFAGRESDIVALWNSPRQREAYDWFAVELANLRTAFRWAADHDDLDDAATIATYAALISFCVENFEVMAWVEEMIEPARAVDHPRLTYLYTMGSLCWFVGRVEEAVRYCDAAQEMIGRGRAGVPFGLEGWLGGAYLAIGQPDRAVAWCRARLAGMRDADGFITALLVTSLTMAGRDDEAIAAADGVVDIAEATRNPYALSLALLAYGMAWRNADPDRAAEAMHRGLAIARDSGNRYSESHLADHLSPLEVECGDALAALDHITFAIRRIHDSGNIGTLRSPLANLATFLDRLGHHEPAATIMGFAFSPLTAAGLPQTAGTIAHLRDVLGDQVYESLARKGEAMTTAAMANYAYDQIDQARAELNAVQQ